MAQGNFSNVEIKGSPGLQSVSISDSLIIDLSKYWTGGDVCYIDKYNPVILFAAQDSSLVEISSKGATLKLVPQAIGKTKISVYGNREFVSDDCGGTRLSRPIEFNVEITQNGSSSRKDSFSSTPTNQILSFSYRPENFAKGDTVQIIPYVKDWEYQDTTFYANGTSIYEYRWILDNAYILAKSCCDCETGFTSQRPTPINVLVTDTTGIISGYLSVDDYDESTVIFGKGFNIQTK